MIFKTLGFLIGITLFIFFSNILIYFFTNDDEGFKFVKGEKESNNVIAVIEVNGPIINNYNKTLVGNIVDYIDPDIIKKNLTVLGKISPKILIIKINSPGGTVVASSSLETIIRNFKSNHKTEIYFHSNELLASGGYWVATSGDKIYANYGAIIGSIGVSGPSWYYYDNPISISTGILGQSIETKNGIKVFDQYVGISKDLYNPFRKPTKKELDHLNKLTQSVYNDFLFKVSKSRKIEINTLENEIGALIFSSSQAKKNFLIDDVINYEQLINRIVKDKGFENYKLYEMQSSDNLISRYFNSFLNNNHQIICKKLNTNLFSILPTFLNNC